MRKKSKKSGFGLLEVVLAAGILIIVIGATVTLANMAVKNSVISMDRTQAYNLAREGMELVRSIRDTAWIDGNPTTDWQSGLPLSQDSDDSYGLVYNQLGNKKWSLQKTGSEIEGGIQTIPLGQQTYSRKIFILPADAGIDNNQLMRKVVVKVEWQDYGLPWSTEISSLLSDWKPAF